MSNVKLYETSKFNPNIIYGVLGVFSSVDIAIKTCDLINTTTTTSCAVYLDDKLIYDTSDF